MFLDHWFMFFERLGDDRRNCEIYRIFWKSYSLFLTKTEHVKRRMLWMRATIDLPLFKQRILFSIKPLGFEWVLNVYYGKRSNFVMVSRLSSHAALLTPKICAVGLISSFVSRHPAGTARMSPSWVHGRAEPQILQKLLLWRVFSSVKLTTASTPDAQVNIAELENRLAAKAEPVSFWQCLQWHR